MGYRSMNEPRGVGSRAGRRAGRARAVGGRPLQRDSRLLGSVDVKRDALGAGGAASFAAGGTGRTAKI